MSSSQISCETNPKDKMLTILEMKAEPSRIDKNDLIELYLNIKKVFFPEANSTKEIQKYIKLIFEKEKPADLCNKFEYLCCNEAIHTARCIYKWKIVKQSLLNYSEVLEIENKPIFSINKRQNSRCKILLNSNQPSWIHKIFLQSVLNTRGMKSLDS